jgi:CDP-glucose 4,6-dehydratase
MEGLVNDDFWRGKRVLVTGHTGFKGAWLCVWLTEMGAEVTGYALPPEVEGIFQDCCVEDRVRSRIGDLADLDGLKRTFAESRPEVVFHLAAQALVRRSYREPLATLSTNVLGTAHVLEAVRSTDAVRSVVVVTTDKCYENREWVWGYRECDPLGGRDPYSASKAAAEIVTAAYRESFFPTARHDEHRTAIATARAGNVIGGGDWAEDRLVPDILRALLAGRPVPVRNPLAIRPWQHVLEPLAGYLKLAQQLYLDGATFASAWNFGPPVEGARSVSWVVDYVLARWEGNQGTVSYDGGTLHEAHYLKLDSTKAIEELRWHPVLSLDAALDSVIDWHQARLRNQPMHDFTVRQIRDYERRVGAAALGESASGRL